jgi:ubiquinone/menaquinone biosynthesis C-methylase UbiE
MSKKNIRDHWNLTSAEYQEKFLVPTEMVQYAIYGPTEGDLNLLGNVKGKKIIELGCGGAQSSIVFAKRGAICTGVDMSVKQLNYAKNLVKNSGVEIDLIEGDIEDLNMLDANSFDIAFSIYAFDWLQNLEKAFSEAYRILKKPGILLFTRQHPFFNLMGDIQEELKVKLNYFERKDICKEGSGITINYFNPTIGDLINGLIEAGFTISKILEPEPIKERINPKLEGYPLEVLEQIPSTIIIKAVKL